SVPGVPNDKVRVTMSGGSLRSAGGGKYVAQVSAAGTATVSVGAEIGGKQMTMGSFPYRIKRVPDPVATMASSKGGVLNKNVILAGTLIPILENFDFELFFKITEFECTVVSKGRDPEKFKGSGNQLSGGMRDAIGKARSGDKVYFEYIKARMTTGSDQSTRSLPALAFTIQ
ncbi:MAG: GldM family protein, partial [Bacteroidota bacterium]